MFVKVGVRQRITSNCGLKEGRDHRDEEWKEGGGESAEVRQQKKVQLEGMLSMSIMVLRR